MTEWKLPIVQADDFQSRKANILVILVSTPPYSQWLDFAVVENFVHYIMKEPTVAEHCFSSLVVYLVEKNANLFGLFTQQAEQKSLCKVKM